VSSRREWLALSAGALGAALGVGSARAGSPGEAIRVDQLGYRPGDRKLALVAGAPERFAVLDAATRRVVFEGRPGAPGLVDPATADRVAVLDFTPLRAPGEYVVTAPGAVTSPAFRVAADVYAGALRAVLESYTWQRCGAPLDPRAPWGHPPCHREDAPPWGGGARRDVTGGWHDAGDYGKYVPPAAVTLWYLAALQEAPALRRPPLLAEMRWELDWLLRMQRDDGAVHHKVGPARWSGDRPPHEDREPRYLFEVSSTATATMAAAAAQASTLFAPADPAYAGRLVARAQAAWEWLLRNPGVVPRGGFRNPPGVDGSGAYDDDDDRDERFWAAVELWRATGQPDFRGPALAGLRAGTAFGSTASWQSVQNLACLSLLAPRSPLDREARDELADALRDRCRDLVAMIERSGYRAALRPGDYYWGSNGLALARAVDLLAGFHEARRAEYREAALDQLHYVLGRNALGKSFVTGLGADPPRRPYHQPSLTNPRRAVLPGLVVGGPNAHGKRLGGGAAPARAYRDDDRLYEVNEPAIYWTAALAHVLAALAPDGAGSGA
jgi:endoglucanase